MVNRLTSRRTLILLAAFLTACTNPFFAARLDRPAGPDKEPEPVPVVYTITFDSHDGSAVEAITGDEGTQVSKPEDPVKTGFIFSGWFDAESGGTAYTWPHTLTENLTMHARWTAFYTVTFDKNGGNTEAEPRTKTLSPPATTVDALPAPPERIGYIFTGWNTQADLMGDSFTAATAVTEDITVYAYWIADQPSSALTLYKGTSVVDPGKKVEEISDMASLVAWLLRPGSLASSTEYLAVLGSDLELTTGFVLGGIPLLYNNITITIQGDAPARTIKMKGTSYLEIGSGVTIRLGSNIRLRGYNQNDDGENNDMPLVYIDGGALEMLAGSEISGNVNQQSEKDAYGGGVYLKSGSFAMKGGVVKDNAINVDSGNTGYGAGVFVNGGTFSIEGDAQVDTGNEVCLWGSPVITLTGNLSATVAALIRPNSYTDGAAVLGGAAAVVAANYGKFQVQPDGSDVWTIGSDGKLVAPWYAVAWELNGGAWPGGVSPESQVETGGKITRPADPVKANYALAGWYKEAALTTPWDFDTDTVRTGITLHARWIPSYTVTFNADGGTPAPVAQTVAEGGTVTAPAAPAKAGYAFGGWYKEAALTTLWDFDTDTVTADITLYARWIPSYTVTFNANGGTPTPAAQTVTSGGKVTAPVAMTKMGNDFGGWYKEAALTNLWDFATDTVTANITLYAKWTASSFATPGQYRTMVLLNGGTITGNSAYYYNTDYEGRKGVFIEGRTVILSPFSIAKYETTYELWYEVKQWAVGNGYTFANAGREGYNGTDGAAPTTAAKTQPVTYINWRDAVIWCNAYSEMSGKEPVYYTNTSYTTVLKTSTNMSGSNTEADNAKMKPGANGYRLPTEAEWEYAARGGGTPSLTGSFAYKWAGTNSESALGNYAWYSGNSGSTNTYAVGGKTANSAGLYDMSGNVAECCWDWEDSIGTGTETNPTGPATGLVRVYRGGSFAQPALASAVANRGIGVPYQAQIATGLRVACTGWITPNYTVTFNTNGGTPTPAAQNVASGDTVTTPATITKADYAFGGWYRETTLTIPWNFASDTVTANITLYAKWTIPSFTTPGQYRTIVLLNGGTITGNSAYYYDSRYNNTKGVFIEGRTVILSPFSIAKYETTYELWYEVKQWAIGNGYTFANAGREGDRGTDGAAPTTAAKTEPVTTINWRDAVIWCNAYSEMSGKEPVYYTNTSYTTVLKTSTNMSGSNTEADNAKMKPGANGYRLPTEAEWEYAARGGNPSLTGSFAYKWAGTNSESALGNYAWYEANSGLDTHPVGGKIANSAGLYDMTGNVDELCWDWEDSIGTGTETNPTGPATGLVRVCRGGSSGNYAGNGSPIAWRTFFSILSHSFTGFRVVARP